MAVLDLRNSPAFFHFAKKNVQIDAGAQKF